MKEFYSGNIVNVNELMGYNYNIDIIDAYANDYCKNVYYALSEFSSGQINNYKKEDIDKLIIEMIKLTPISQIGLPIIYYKVYDENGNPYAKEVVTEAIFPIKNDYSSYDIKYSNGEVNAIYYDKENDVVYTLNDNPIFNGFHLLNGFLRLEHHICQDDRAIFYNMKLDEVKEIVINGKKHNIVCTIPKSFQVEIMPKMEFSNNQTVNYASTSERLANALEVRNYFAMFEKGFGKRKRKKEYYLKLRELFLTNDLKNINLSDEFIDENESSKVKKMQY